MKKKIQTGLVCGSIAGIIDIVPMIIQKLTWDANLAAFTMWIIIGFFISTIQINLNPILKGILIALLCLLPSAFIIGWHEPVSLIPIFLITVVLGGLLGSGINRIISKQKDGNI